MSKKKIVDIYNTYARQYNNASNKIGVTNDLDDRRNKLKTKLHEIREQMDEYGFTPEVVKEMARAVKDDNQKVLAKIKQGLQFLVDDNNYSKDQTDRVLQQMVKYAQQYEMTEANALIIQRILKKTANNQYPDTITLWDQLSKVEKDNYKRDTFDNETKLQMMQAAIDTAPMKVRIYEEAYKVISEDDKHLNSFLTESGNSNTDLYNPIFMRTDYTQNQVRHHIDKAINEGIDPNLPGINKKLVDGMLLDLLSDMGFNIKDVNN